MEAIEEIKRLQIGKENRPEWMIGQQLIDMIKADERIAPIIGEDLQNPGMSLEKCAEAMKKRADEIHSKTKGNCVCITPAEAEKVIRKFYGLPDPDETVKLAPPEEAGVFSDVISLEDFL